MILGRRKIWEMQPKYQSFKQLRISLQRTSCLLNVSLGPHCPPRHSRAPEHHINHYSLSMIVSITLIPLKLLLELKARVTGKKSSGLPPTLNSRLPLLLFESINGCWRETLILVREGAQSKIRQSQDVYHLPKKGTSPVVHGVVAIAFCHIGRAHTVGHGDCDFYILESQGYNFDR